MTKERTPEEIELLEFILDGLNMSETLDSEGRFTYSVGKLSEDMFFSTIVHPLTHKPMTVMGVTEQDVIKKVDWLIDSIPPEGVTVF